MLKLKKEELINEEAVRKVQFDNVWYFDVESVAVFLKEDLSDVEGITLPFGDSYKKAATLESIEKGRKKSPVRIQQGSFENEEF